MEYKFLNKINSPLDVKKLNIVEANELCTEIRNCIIETVSKNGGHLASNLGTIELTVALHRAFNSPKDAIIFDVGHQSYTHKLLTGRFNEFSTLRKENGISGFMKPCESEHDPFITGHSSNSISAAYGIYKAKRLTSQEGTAIAVIGDGALTGGMAYEALNNCGSGRNNFIIVLNDNKMSISRNVGALARSLTKMRNKPKYHNFKFAINNILLAIPLIGKPLNSAVFSIKETVKNMIYKNNIFTSMGFNYLGPVDGHNIKALESIFDIAKSYNRPTLIHVLTTKGKGYSFAENSPKNYHGVSPFDIDAGATFGNKKTYSDIAGQALCDLAQKDEKICAITAAMTEGTGLSNFANKYKNRFFDVGIAEQHAVTFTAGLVKGGLKPYFVVYSSFLQRAYDQLIHDTAIDNLPSKFLIDRAGIVGEDGETHQGLFDVSFLTTIPNIEIYSPCYFSELYNTIINTASLNKTIAIRYPRGCEMQEISLDYSKDFTVVEGESKNSLITYGRLFSNAIEAKEKVTDLNIVKLNKIYPFSNDLISKLLTFDNIQFFEESIKNGSIAEHLLVKLLENGYKGKFEIHAINNKFIPPSTVSSALKENGLDTNSMINSFNKE